MLRLMKSFLEKICRLINIRDATHTMTAKSHLLTNKMIIKFEITSEIMNNRIISETSGIDIHNVTGHGATNDHQAHQEKSIATLS